MIGQKLTEAWGQQIIVDSRPGANGNIGVDILARSAPDGYTLCLMDVGNLSISPSMYSKLPFDIIRDLAPITMVSYSPHLVTVHPSVPVKSVQELIALAKKNPGKLNVPVGLGSSVHLAGLLLQQRTGAKWVYVPTKGGQSSILTVATGEGDLLFMGMLQTLPHVKAGRLKAHCGIERKTRPRVTQRAYGGGNTGARRLFHRLVARHHWTGKTLRRDRRTRPTRKCGASSRCPISRKSCPRKAPYRCRVRHRKWANGWRPRKIDGRRWLKTADLR